MKLGVAAAAEYENRKHSRRHPAQNLPADGAQYAMLTLSDLPAALTAVSAAVSPASTPLSALMTLGVLGGKNFA